MGQIFRSQIAFAKPCFFMILGLSSLMARSIPVLAQDTQGARQACTPEPPVQARLYPVLPLSMAKSVQLVLEVHPLVPLQNAEIIWETPPDVEVVRGTHGLPAQKLSAHTTTKYTLTIRFKQHGEFPVTASAIERGKGYLFGRRLTLWFYVGDAGVEVQNQRRWNPIPPDAKPVQLPDGKRGGSDFIPQGGTGRASVSGYLFYRHHDHPMQPAWNASVQVWDRDSDGHDDLLAESIVDARGFYFAEFDNANDESGTQDVYLRFLARNARVQVADYDTGDVVSVSGPDLGDDIADGNHLAPPVEIDEAGPGTYPDNGWEAAFEICETVTLGWIHYHSLGYDAAPVTVHWKPGGTDGARYDYPNRRIFVRDGDQYDPSVLLHEYGHHIYYIVHGGGPPGTGLPHQWFGCYNGGLALDEGWASYSGQSTLNHPVFLDQPGAGDTSMLQVDVEATTGNCLDADAGTTGEASVVSSLWDIFDPAEAIDPSTGGPYHPNDSMARGADVLWDVCLNGGFLNHLRDFIDIFLTSHSNFWPPAERGDFYGIFIDHRVLPAMGTRVSVSNLTGKIGTPVTLRGRLLAQPPDAPLRNRSMLFRVETDDVGTGITDDNGDGQLIYTIPESLGAGAKYFSVQFHGDASFNDSAGDATLNVSKGDIVVRAVFSNPSVAETGQSVTLSALLQREATGNTNAAQQKWVPLSGKPIHFYIAFPLTPRYFAGTAVTNAIGEASVSYQVHVIGTRAYRVDAEFPGDELYSASTGFGGIYVAPASQITQTQLTTPGASGAIRQTVPLRAALRRLSDNFPVTQAGLGFYREGWQFLGSAATNTQGEAVLNYKIPEEWGTGTHNIVVKYTGAGTLNASSGTIMLTINTADTYLNVWGGVGRPGETVQIYATLHTTSETGSSNHINTTSPVRFFVRGQEIGVGRIEMPGTVWRYVMDYMIPADTQAGGLLPVTVQFDGNELYNASSQNDELHVVKTETWLREDFLSTSGAIGQTVAMGAFLLDLREQPIQSQTLVFKLDGIPIGTALTNPRGYAALLYNLPESLETGNKTITVEFEATDLYDASSGTGNLDISAGNVILQVPDHAGRRLTTVSLSAILRQANFPIPVTGRSVTFKLGGETIGTATTGDGGRAVLHYFIPASLSLGNHPFAIEFAGDNTFGAAVGGGTLRVLPRGDVSGDGKVDDMDLLMVLFAFGQTGQNLPEDLNGDGIVDDVDLLEVLFDFGAGG